jgi:hypothetical protein
MENMRAPLQPRVRTMCGKLAIYTHLSFGPPDSVAGRQAYRAEPVDRDTEHGVDRTEAGRVVDGQPQIAQYFAKRPVLHCQNVDRVEWH